MIRMIVTDLDNTLLHSDKSISDFTIKALKKCQAKGIKIVFATARSTRAASKMLAQFTPDIFVGYGGALVQAGEGAIHCFDISAELSHQLIQDCLAAPEVLSILAINESAALTNDLNADNELPHYQYADFSNNYGHRYLKISVYATSPAAVEKIASRYPTLDMLRYSGEDLYRFANKDAVKWNAVKAIAAHYSLSTEAFIAFGDDVNDLEMLANCGVGVAVENAIDEAKAAAGHICGANDGDGVAKWLEEHIL